MRLRAYLFASCFVMAFAGAAYADPSSADVATARNLYNDGTTALDAKDYPRAEDRLLAAWALVQTPIIGVALAEAESARGKYLEAQEVCFAIDRIPPAPNETQAGKDARVRARTIGDDASKHLGSVVFVVKGDPNDGKIAIDNVVVPPQALGAARAVNPGTHVVTLKTAAMTSPQTVKELSVGEGVTANVEVVIPAPVAIGPEPPPAKAAPLTEPPKEEPRERHLPALFWVGAGVGAAGVVVGSVFGALAFSAKSDVADQCPTKVCPQSTTDTIDRSQTFGNVSTVAFIVGGVGAAVAVVALVTRPTKPAAKPFSFSF